MGDKTFRQGSRDEWVSTMSGGLNDQQIATGALQRIADATEAMAKNWNQLQAERDRYKRWYEDSKAEGERIARSNAALRGVIKRLRNAQCKEQEKP